MAGPDGTRWDERYAGEAWPEEPDELLVERAGAVPPGVALDLACGPGRNAVHLARHGWAVTGVDASPVGLAQAARRAAAAGVRLELVEADLSTWRPRPASARLVVVANFHLPAEDRPGFFAAVVEAVVPGGHVFVLGHHRDSPSRPRRFGAERGYTPELLAELLAPLRVEVVEHERPGRDGGPSSRKLAAWATADAPAGDPPFASVNIRHFGHIDHRSAP